MKIKLAHFPFLETLDAFEFVFQPSINERQVQELATMRFVASGENVLLLGPPGVGKTHVWGNPTPPLLWAWSPSLRPSASALSSSWT